MPENDVKLTKLAKCAGCGAKVGAGVLAQLLDGIQVHRDPNLLVGFDKSDDASVYKVSDDLALVQTVDFFPPIADDPYLFGQIAATNALSDVYAMGGEPKLCLNIMAVPESMPKEAVHQLLRGGYDKVYEAGALITGGHSILDDEPKYGLAVTGFVHPDRVLTNSGARPGDVLLLTKPIGIGVLTTAQKAEMLSVEGRALAEELMTTLNKSARDAMVKYRVHACTDVTGFGLLGHSYEMAQGSDVELELEVDAIDLIPEALEFANMGLLPAGMYRNRAFAEAGVDAGETALCTNQVTTDMAENLSINAGSKEEKYRELLPQLYALISTETDFIANLANLSAALKQTFNFFWVGFYLVKGDELVLGPFQGPIACTRIRFGRGVCGTAWKEAHTLIVPDVEQFPGHIACSSDSKSEIVVPMMKEGNVIGVLDIDSDSLDSFDDIDAHYLEEICTYLR